MNTPADTLGDSSSRDPWRALRYAYRLPLLLIHLLVALPLVLIVISSVGPYLRWSGERLDHRVIRGWSGMLVRVFGFRIRGSGEALPGAVMFVANHLSWLDIELLHSQRMMCFVAKHEISRWPLVGWLAGRAGTIYHKRGNSESLSNVSQIMVERLHQGLAVGAFPEGGTTRGDKVRVFHARIFQAAVEAGVPVQPVALRYSQDRESQSPRVPFGEGESFFANFWRLLGEPAMYAEVIFCQPIEIAGEGRRHLAELSRTRIRTALGHGEHD